MPSTSTTQSKLFVQAAGQQAEVSLPRTLFSSLTVQNKGQDADQEKFEADPLFSEGQSWEGHPPPPPPVRPLTKALEPLCSFRRK